MAMVSHLVAVGPLSTKHSGDRDACGLCNAVSARHSLADRTQFPYCPDCGSETVSTRETVYTAFGTPTICDGGWHDIPPARAQIPEIDRNEAYGQAPLVARARWHPIGGKFTGLGDAMHGGSIEECDDTRCKGWVRTRVAGVGPDAPIETNAEGASQSKVDYHFHTLDPQAMLVLAQVQAHGDNKYGVNNWHGIPTSDHINHALIHIYAWLAGDKQDDHLEHALARVFLAVATDRREATGA